jgi:hypothetical protein
MRDYQHLSEKVPSSPSIGQKRKHAATYGDDDYEKFIQSMEAKITPQNEFDADLMPFLLVAQIFGFLALPGVDRVVSVDLHAAQVQGFFDIPVDHLSASPVLIKWFKTLKLSNRVFVSPDVGNVKRAQVYAGLLGGEICIIDKRRKSGSEAIAQHLIGEVTGKNVIMVDDMISTGGTMTVTVNEQGQATLSVSKKGTFHSATDASPYSFAAITATGVKEKSVATGVKSGTGIR